MKKKIYLDILSIISPLLFLIFTVKGICQGSVCVAHPKHGSHALNAISFFEKN